ncbi:MAG TPA: CoA pyrophosphatase [Myxococcota bacterium]|nr:CoA pyrophosphatase [Myxococcota bacterium]
MDAAGLTMPEIRRRLAAHAPLLAAGTAGPEPFRAAVAVVFSTATTGAVELLFIERARREGDPWSGQMAFPGGRAERADPDLAATAAREAREEVGLALARPIARLDDFENSRNPRMSPLVVSPFVYQVEGRPPLAPNPEVQSTVWIPVEWILHPDAAVDYRFERDAQELVFPAVRYDRFTVWGLTYRILVNMFAVLGLPLRPAP